MFVLSDSFSKCVSLSQDVEPKGSYSKFEDRNVQIFGTDREDASYGTAKSNGYFIMKCVAVSADGSKVIRSASDGKIRMFHANDVGSANTTVLFGHDLFVTCVAWSRDGKRVVPASNDNMFKFGIGTWRREAGETRCNSGMMIG